jgi:hypothetical protein
VRQYRSVGTMGSSRQTDAIVQLRALPCADNWGRSDMPLFMAAIKFSATSTKAVVDKPQDRRPSAKAALEAAGCTLKEYYFAISARSRGAPVLSSIEAAVPMPRQRPRRRASARRASNPAQSPNSTARRSDAG